MRRPSFSFTRRLIGISFATALLAGSLAGTASAASPAGDTFDADHSFRDQPGIAVLAVYPFGDGPVAMGYVRIKGPGASWIDSHPLAQGSVGWRVLIQTAPTKNGPWTTEIKTGLKHIVANKTGPLESFKARNVNVESADGKYVRVVSRLVWFNEDGGVLGWVRHEYTRYGLVVSSGIQPDFGDHTAARSNAAPRIWAS